MVGQIVDEASTPDFHDWMAHVKGAAGCTHPIRRQGNIRVNNTEGQHLITLSTDDMPDGAIYTYTPCGNRRASVCPSCREFFDASGGTYGSPRIVLDLWAAGYQVSENTVAKLMAQLGLAGRKPRRRPRHLASQGKRACAPDLVRRKFAAVAPNVLWCGDLTQVDTEEGRLYLATVLDLFSRRLLGYAMSEHHDAVLAKASLQMAAATRGDVEGVIFHSDRGSTTAPTATPRPARALGVIRSMGRVGAALDNAAAEAFNSIIKVAYIHRHRFRTRAEARRHEAA